MSNELSLAPVSIKGVFPDLPVPMARPIIGEEEKSAVLAVLDSGNLAQGEKVAEFEQAFAGYCEAQFAVATSSGTAALFLALLAHGIGPGDEVIVPAFSFIATASAVSHTGAKPVFAEIDPSSFNLAPENLESYLTECTRAILPVHLYGQSANLKPIMEFAAKHALVVIEDAAQAHGETYYGRKIGSFNTTCFSFYPTKNITSGEGGMITTNDPAIMERVTLLRQHGSRQRYFHEELGFNLRMSDIHAAIGLAQLPKLADWNTLRRKNAHFYAKLLGRLAGSIRPPVELPWANHVYNQFTLRVEADRRQELTTLLDANEIGYGIYYPFPLYTQPAYRANNPAVNLPLVEQACREVLSLPVHPQLSEAQLEKVGRVLSDFGARCWP